MGSINKNDQNQKNKHRLEIKMKSCLRLGVALFLAFFQSQILSLVFSSSAIADEAELPTFESKPSLFVERVRQAVTGQLLLGDITSTSAKFHLWAGGFGGGHLCTISGSANSSDGRWYEYVENSCHLKMRVDGDTIYVMDRGGHCSHDEHHCGYRAGIEAMRLKPASLSESMYWHDEAR